MRSTTSSKAAAASFLSLLSFLLLLSACQTPSREEVAEENVGEVLTGDEVETLETVPEDLVLLRYQLEQGQEVVTGSVMNNTTAPMVNIQVAFDLYRGEEFVTTAADTTSELGPGESWQFAVSVPPGNTATRAVPSRVEGTPKPPTGGAADPHYPQNNPGYDIAPEEPGEQ